MIPSVGELNTNRTLQAVQSSFHCLSLGCGTGIDVYVDDDKGESLCHFSIRVDASLTERLFRFFYCLISSMVLNNRACSS